MSASRGQRNGFGLIALAVGAGIVGAGNLGGLWLTTGFDGTDFERMVFADSHAAVAAHRTTPGAVTRCGNLARPGIRSTRQKGKT